MKKKDMLSKLEKALSILKVSEGIHLGEDTFLVEGGLDGSDKCYGFTKEEDGELRVITRQVSQGYPIQEMNKSDLDYIFGTDIIAKIKSNKYEKGESDIIF